MERQLQQLLERGVKALEKLAEDPVVQIEAGPPVCPHCGVFNPNVEIEESVGQGALFSFFTDPKCMECGQKFYAIPMDWMIFEEPEGIRTELERRAELVNEPGANGR